MHHSHVSRSNRVIKTQGAHIGHGAIIHGATIGKNCLVGMNAVIMDNVELGDECIVGALTFIKQDEKIPARSLVAGNPGKIIKQVTDEMLAWKTEGTKLYQSLPKEMFEGWKECEPLREFPIIFLYRLKITNLLASNFPIPKIFFAINGNLRNLIFLFKSKPCV